MSTEREAVVTTVRVGACPNPIPTLDWLLGRQEGFESHRFDTRSYSAPMSTEREAVVTTVRVGACPNPISTLDWLLGRQEGFESHRSDTRSSSAPMSTEREAVVASFLVGAGSNPLISTLDWLRGRQEGFESLLQNKPAEAEPKFAQLVDHFKGNLKDAAPIYWGRAKARLDQGKYEGCIEDSKKAIELDRSTWNPYLYGGIAYFHQKRYDEARSILLMGVDLAPNNRSDFYNIISKLDEALVAGNAGSVLAGNGDPEPIDPEHAGNGDPEHADPVDPEHVEVIVDLDQFIPLYVKTLTCSDIGKALVISRDVSQDLFNEAMAKGVFDAHTNTLPIHLINGAGGEITEAVMNRADNRCRVNWKGFLALNPELIVGQRVFFSKQWVQVLGVATLILKVVPV